jgi:hypothetical protein
VCAWACSDLYFLSSLKGILFHKLLINDQIHLAGIKIIRRVFNITIKTFSSLATGKTIDEPANFETLETQFQHPDFSEKLLLHHNEFKRIK